MEYRSSVGWFETSSSQKKFRAVPFVSKSGKFSIHTLYVWKCYPEQLIFSLVSTVYFRLLRILRKRFGLGLHRRLMNCAFKVATMYSVSRHNWIIDRFLGMSRKGTSIRAIENHVHYCICELDENKRFVYSQAYFQANWLKFQVFRPRDKSRDGAYIGSHLRNLGFTDMRLLCERKTGPLFQRLSNLWEVDPFVTTTGPRHLDGDSEVGSYVSETPWYSKEAEEAFFSSEED